MFNKCAVASLSIDMDTYYLYEKPRIRTGNQMIMCEFISLIRVCRTRIQCNFVCLTSCCCRYCCCLCTYRTCCILDCSSIAVCLFSRFFGVFLHRQYDKKHFGCCCCFFVENGEAKRVQKQTD